MPRLAARGRCLRLLSGSLLLVLLLGAAALPGAADGGLGDLEHRFQDAVRGVVPATVLLAPAGVSGPGAGSSSGVIVSGAGLVLSDGDAGVVFLQRGGQRVKEWRSEVEVRIPDPAGGPARRFRGVVLGRDFDADTSLVSIRDVPSGGLPFVAPARSGALAVGDFVFAVGSSFDEEGKMLPTLTSGIVAALERADSGGPTLVFTTAAVNDGVNGGPVVDLSGRLVGTVSTYASPEPAEKHQFLGKVVPIDRILEAHAGLEAGRSLAARAAAVGDDAGGHPLEAAFGAAAARAWPLTVSLEVARSRQVSGRVPLEVGDQELPRYQGPVTGLLVSSDGEIVTSLYNLTNVGALVEPLWRAPPSAGVEEGLADVLGVTAHLAPGISVPARVLGYDVRLGVVLLKADLPAGSAARLPAPLPPVPAADWDRGRFVLVVGNPYGARRPRDPFLTAGILSKEHPEDVAAAWRGTWQTDAAGLDTNAGGPAVDLEGRLYGLLTLWYPSKHGRNSGIAFVVPWDRIRAALPDLRVGRRPRPALLGVTFAAGLRALVQEVSPGSGAERAGLLPGDVVLRVDREDVATVAEAVAAIRFRFAGEAVRLEVDRRGQIVTLQAVLGER